ncbi:MAG TPA: arginine deiminase-related protein [Steroidobacteraceae bacterium]
MLEEPAHAGITPGPATGAQAQTAAAVLMVRPANFAWNVETHASNRFQREDPELASKANARACVEFDALARNLRESGVVVHAVADETPPVRPDAVFPNNWISLHADGTVVLYPMLAANRRLERRPELITELVQRGGYRVERLLDLTHHEAQGRFLEGTGSIVFDHAARVAYACLSPRTHREPLDELCTELGYAACAFDAADPAGVPIYHTNVMLAIGTRQVVLAGHAVAAADRARVIQRLRDSGRTLEPIDATQMAGFAGNVLELRAADGGRVLVMSETAARAFGPAALDRLHAGVDRVVITPVPTIETLGGGSVRCMLAEVFLPT